MIARAALSDAKALPTSTGADEVFDLFLDATDARVIGQLLLAFAEAKARGHR